MNQNLFPLASHHAPRLADLLIRAAAIYSMAQDRMVYQALAIRDEWIVAVSQDLHSLDGLITADTQVLDAPDLTILPAFETPIIISCSLRRTWAWCLLTGRIPLPNSSI
jgi:hypothetical protein